MEALATPTQKISESVGRCHASKPRKGRKSLREFDLEDTTRSMFAEPAVARLVSNIQWALAEGLGARDLVPMLESLLAAAPPGSDEELFAQQQLSEIIVEKRPWQAALLARQALARVPHPRTWSVLGLAHTLLGNYRSAARAYRQSLAMDPACPSTAHNLGHLLDVALGRPCDALRYLELAHRLEPDEPELASSYAHALVRVGQREKAYTLLLQSQSMQEAEANTLLDRWLSRVAALV